MLDDKTIYENYKFLVENDITNIILDENNDMIFKIYFNGIINQIPRIQRFEQAIEWLCKKKIVTRKHIDNGAIARNLEYMFKEFDIAIITYGIVGLLELKKTGLFNYNNLLDEKKVIKLAIQNDIQIDGQLKEKINKEKEKILAAKKQTIQPSNNEDENKTVEDNSKAKLLEEYKKELLKLKKEKLSKNIELYDRYDDNTFFDYWSIKTRCEGLEYKINELLENENKKGRSI